MTEKAAKVLSEAQRLLGALLHRVDAVVNGVEFAEEDSVGLMLLCYSSRFTEHATAILALGAHPDAALVARSALEGEWQFKWMLQDPTKRARQWRTFAPVRDWRVVRELKESGSLVDARWEKAVEEGVATHGALHRSAQASKSAAAGRPEPVDPYNRNWHGMSIKELADAVGATEEYDSIYDDFSERHHWGLGDIVQKLSVEGKRMKWRSQSPANAVIALATVFSCFLECTQQLDTHFNLGLADTVRQAYVDLQLATGISVQKA